jgi:RNA recognition motif-containing protein
VLPQAQTNGSFLEQNFGMSSEDSAKLALAIKLLSDLPIPSKLLNVKIPNPSNKNSTSSSYASKQSSSFNPASNIPLFGQYPPNPYGNPYSMYQFPSQVPSISPYGGSSSMSALPGQSQTTLYVRNLPSSAKEEEILSVFQNFGTIKEARFQKSKETQEFFGSVFIEYVHASAARLAHIQLNEKLWGERTVHIDFAKERGQQQKLGEDGLPKSETNQLPSNSLYVSNLPSDVDKNVLLQIFSRFGSILDARPMKNESGNSKGIAFIDFAMIESAAAAIDALDNTIYGTKTIRVSYAANPSKRKGDDLGQPDMKRTRADQALGGIPGYPVQMYYDPNQLPFPGQPPAADPQTQWYAQGQYF